jgi:hypothetical protein
MPPFPPAPVDIEPPTPLVEDAVEVPTLLLATLDSPVVAAAVDGVSVADEQALAVAAVVRSSSNEARRCDRIALRG